MRDHNNLHAALRWAIEQGKVEEGLRVGVASAHVWYMRGHYSEGRERLAELLSLRSSYDAPDARARALTSAGHLAYCQADLKMAQDLLEESLRIWKVLGNDEHRAVALQLLANVVRFRAHLSNGVQLLEEVRTINHRLGHRMREAMNCAFAAQVLFARGDRAVSRRVRRGACGLPTRSCHPPGRSRGSRSRSGGVDAVSGGPRPTRTLGGGCCTGPR